MKHPVYDAMDNGVRDKVQAWLNSAPSHFINGERVRAESSLEVVDPGTLEVISHLARGSSKDVDRAVAGAVEGFEKWRGLRPSKRAELLEAAAVVIRNHTDELALLETLDTGKPLRTASGEVWWASDSFRYFSGLATKVDGRTTSSSAGIIAASVREPLGVCAAITAWNFPAILMGFKVPPALAAGNAVVVKPSEEASLSSLRVAELLVEAGIPAGVVNVVTGTGAEAGAALVEHPDVRAVTFTGSTTVGRTIGAVAGSRLIPAGLELGGKSAQVVFEDTGLARAIPALARGIFQNAGQMCAAGSRILVHADKCEELIERLSRAAEDLTIGHGLTAGSEFGPIISQRQFQRIDSYVQGAKARGGVVHSGGGRASVDLDGYFYQPTVLSGLPPSDPAVCEEIFGPVVTVIPFSSEGEAIDLANGSPYALGASVWSSDADRCIRVAQQLRAGNVWVNGYGLVHPSVPFGGAGDSGLGRDLGPEKLHFYTEEKYLWLGLEGRSI